MFNVPDIDLFASRTNAKCHKYASWLKDPFATHVDAFTVNWHPYFFYPFPPFSIILRVLRKIKIGHSIEIMIVPHWPMVRWFPLLLSMLMKPSIYLQPNESLLISSDRKPHPLWNQLTLVAGKLSGSLAK